MPAKSKAQARLANAAKNNPEFAKKAGLTGKGAEKFEEDFSAKGKAYKSLPERAPKKAK